MFALSTVTSQPLTISKTCIASSSLSIGLGSASVQETSMLFLAIISTFSLPSTSTPTSFAVFSNPAYFNIFCTLASSKLPHMTAFALSCSLTITDSLYFNTAGNKRHLICPYPTPNGPS